MKQNTTPDFHQIIEEYTDELGLLRQNRLQDEGGFIRFSSERGISVWGIITGDPGDFYRRRWLSSDGTNYNGGPLFHPFRMYTLFKILEACKLNIATSSTINRDSLIGLIECALSLMQNVEQIGEMTSQWDQVVNLAILLEPIYWPKITGHLSISGIMNEENFKKHRECYRDKIRQLVVSLNSTDWRKIHESLRFDAANIDDNGSLYLLLRLSSWSQRERLKGHIAGALWFRHMAEVIRRAFEDFTSEKWEEEDQAYGMWSHGVRTNIYGSERPLDDELHSRPYIALYHRLFTGSVIRWYVEGDTEYYAILKILPELSKIGVELVNLHGNIATSKQNVALKLRDCLKEDKALRRFSMISFDTDVAANVKLVKRQIKQKNIIGFIAAHKPDFEFSNFTIYELSDIAAKIYETGGFSGKVIRNANWSGVDCSRIFEERYKKFSAKHPQSLKGKEWGEALASYALEHPHREDDGSERPFWREIRVALQSRVANYDFQKDHYEFNPVTFELIKSNT